MRVRGATLVLLLATAAIVGMAPYVGPPLDPETGSFVWWQLRVPRVVMAALVGGTLSSVGAAYQLVFQNPLATPSTIGTSAGAVLGVLAAVVAGAPSTSANLPWLTLAAFAGALATTVIVAGLAAYGRARMHDILLAGIAVSLAAGAVGTALESVADVGQRFTVSQWSLGHLPQVGYRGVAILLPFLAVAWIGLLVELRALHALTGGEDVAQTQGVDVPRARAVTLGAGAVGVAACVAWCGPIGFVGLIVPHVVRLAGARSPRVLVPLSLVAGMGFLVSCDLVARLVVPGHELPVGVVTAALGAPALLLLLAWPAARRGR
ncbi:MAG: iron ABC transporter permease [Polyangiaceae bacterium]|nr:iron ABC transporter permease [Polyangiaceae bacterium]